MPRREGAGARAADIAAILSERGLGGDDVDLAPSARPVSPRPLAPRRGRAAHGEALGGDCAADARERRPSCRVGAILSLAYPDRIAKNRGAGGAFLLANGRGANVDPASALSREPFLAVAELAGTAAQGRILLAAPITLEEIEARFADQIESREEIAFDAASASLRGRRSERLGALALAEQTAARSTPDAETRAACSPKASRGSASTGCRGRKSLQQWRDRVMFLRRAEGDEWPDLSDAALAASAAEWLAPLLDGKTALSQIGADELVDRAAARCCRGTCKRRLDAEAPTHFAAPSGSSVPIDYEAEEGPKLSIRVQELFGLDRHPSDRRRQGAAGGRAAVAGAPAGAGDARPAGLLARLLRGGEGRDARPLSAPSLAGRSAAARRPRAAPSRAAPDR